MMLNIQPWSIFEETSIKELFLKNPYPFFRATPLGDVMKEHMFQQARHHAQTNYNAVVFDGHTPVATGQVYKIPYLSQYWGISMGGLRDLISLNPQSNLGRSYSDRLISDLLEQTQREKIDFVSCSVPGANIAMVQALEKSGFLYAEGFVNMVGTTDHDYSEFIPDDLVIRAPRESDFDQIKEAYSLVNFPSRYVTDGGFDPDKGFDLYTHRFKEVYEKKLGEVFIAEYSGEFAGALIGIIDSDLFDSQGVKTNILSGMGIIIHPRAARRGVSLALIAHRQKWYRSQGVNWVSFGANFNNLPMIRGLTKLGLSYGSLDVTYHKWINPKAKYKAKI